MRCHACDGRTHEQWKVVQYSVWAESAIDFEQSRKAWLHNCFRCLIPRFVFAQFTHSVPRPKRRNMLNIISKALFLTILSSQPWPRAPAWWCCRAPCSPTPSPVHPGLPPTYIDVGNKDNFTGYCKVRRSSVIQNSKQRILPKKMRNIWVHLFAPAAAVPTL